MENWTNWQYLLAGFCASGSIGMVQMTIIAIKQWRRPLMERWEMLICYGIMLCWWFALGNVIIFSL